MMNLIIRNFQNGLARAINESELPIEVKRLVVRELLTQIEEESTKVLNIELGVQNGVLENDME